MNKLRTLSMLQDAMDKEFSWRLKEIADLKLSVRTSEMSRQRTMIRAGVPLLYAHWEGFVKAASAIYLNYVDTMGLNYEQLSNCFVGLGLRHMIGEMANSKASSKNIAVVDFIVGRMTERATLKFGGAINAESNLNSKRFENIIIAIGIEPGPYKARYNLIDESLLKRRNSIAHGEFVDLKPKDYAALADEVITLLRTYKDDIENAATLESFRRP